MSEAQQRNDIAKGLKRFREHNMQVSGFRAPFLRFNEETGKAVVDNGIDWVSHCTMLYDSSAYPADLEMFGSTRDLVGDFYRSRSHAKEVSLPRWGPHCLEIPVSLPDDELLVDRLGICDSHEVTAIWSDMLDSTREQGELLNLLFHPERIDFVAEPLAALLEQATSHRDVWVSSLDEIRRWWQDRANFSFSLAENKRDTYIITVKASSRASVALQQPGGKLEFLSTEPNGTFALQSTLRPVVGVKVGYSDEDLRYLINEGFFLETNVDPGGCSYALEGNSSRNLRQLLEDVKQARGPLLRFWRWPDRFRSALAITADIDAITIWDFVRRARHFRRISRHRA
jgi:hypothetical protein